MEMSIVNYSSRNRKSSEMTASEFMSVVRLHKVISKAVLLRGSDERMENRNCKMRKLRKQLENFDRMLAEDFECDSNVVRRCRSIILAVQKMFTTNCLALELQISKIMFSYRLSTEATYRLSIETTRSLYAYRLPYEYRLPYRLATGASKAIKSRIRGKNPKGLTTVSEDLLPVCGSIPARGNRLWNGGFVSWLMMLLTAVAVAAFAASYFGSHRSLFRWYEGYEETEVAETYCEAFDRLKCENGGYPANNGYGYECKCVDDYYGQRCTHQTESSAVSRYIGRLFDAVNSDLRRGIPRTWRMLWPFAPDLQQTELVSFYQERMKRMEEGFSSSVGGDGSTVTRVLPAGCPSYSSPADDALPPLNTVYDDIFRRAPGSRLERDPKRRNMLYHTYYQYFVLQFFHADSEPTVTGSQLYGINEADQRELRSFVGGKLRTESYPNNEHYPPRLSLVEKFSKVFSRLWAGGRTLWFDMVAERVVPMANVNPLHHRWAMGHPLLSMNRMLFAMNTLWVREHNRVCDRLAEQHGAWTDEQLYGAAKRIVVSEMMVIMMNDVLNAGGSRWPLRYDPAVYQGRVAPAVGGYFTTPLEMLLTMMMPSGVPEEFENAREDDDSLYGDNSQVFENGMRETVRLMVDRPMGTMSSNNGDAATEPLTKVLMELSRENGVQGFNRYREHVGLSAYGSFDELTGGDRETADKLESLYGHVDRVELLAGMLAEKPSADDSVPTFTVMVNSFVVNAIVTSPLYSQAAWRSETFDDDFGFSAVKSASVATFVCNNLPDGCDRGLVVDLHVQ